MKKFGLVLLGIIAGIVAIANLGSLLALALSALIAYAGFHYFRKSDSTIAKIFWGAVLLIGLTYSHFECTRFYRNHRDYRCLVCVA